MNLNEAYPSKYMTAEDLDGQDVTFTIVNVGQVELGKDEKKEMKLLIALKGQKKGFVCNKTNAKQIAKLLNADDTDDWIGKTIKLGPREVQFGDELVWSIRVISPPPQRRSASTTPDPSDNDLDQIP